MMLANLLKTKPAPNSAVIAVRLKKLEDELATAKAEQSSALDARKNVLLRGSDEDLSKHDAGTAQAMDRLDRRIKDAEYLIPVLKEELRITLETEKTSAIEEERKSAYAEAKARLDAFNKRAPEIERMMTSFVAILIEKRELSELIGRVNSNRPEGTDPLDIPLRAARHSPAPPLPKLGTVTKTRIKDTHMNIRRSGPRPPEDFETYEAPAERPIFGHEPAFDPEPLFRTVTLPPFRKGGPFWRPS